jgi:GT2 family glycosyltransferase
MISFVLLNWNSRGFIDRCVRALRQQTSRAFEVIAVDNGSQNESLAMLRGLRDEGFVGTLVELPENRGFAAGMNAGIARASGDLVVPLNSDVVLARNFVEALLASAAAAGPDVGMWAVPEYVWHWSDAAGSTVDELSNELVTVGVSLVRRLSVSAWHPAVDDRSELFGPEGTAPVFSAAAIERARRAAGHVYDEAYGSYGEDIDLLLRLASLGVRSDVCLRTAIWHVGSASTGGLFAYNSKPPHLQAMAQRNRLRNYSRLGGVNRRLGVLPWVALDDLYRIAAVKNRRQMLGIVMDGYTAMGRLRAPSAYPLQGLKFAGNVFSRSARLRASGELPALPLDLDQLKPE